MNRNLFSVIAIAIGVLALFFGILVQGKLEKLKSQLNEEFFGVLSRLLKEETEEKTIGSPVGYILKFENGVTFYVSGDSGITAEMETIQKIYNPDVAFLAIGGGYTMGEEEAAYAATLVKPRKFVVPYHYKSFPMLGSSNEIFQQRVREFKTAGKLLADPLIFEIDEEKDVLGVKVRWLGHGSFLFISPQGKRLLVDPSESVPGWPARYREDITQLGGVDLVLITHAHFDHFHIPTLKKIVAAYQTPILVPFELAFYAGPKMEAVLIGANMDSSLNAEVLKNLSGVEVNIGTIEIHMVPANHSSSVFTLEPLPPVEAPIFK